MDPDLDPTLDPAPVYSTVTLRMQKKSFHIFFLITYPQAHYLQSYIFNFLLKSCVKILFCKHFSPLNIFMRKGKDPESDPDPYL